MMKWICAPTLMVCLLAARIVAAQAPAFGIGGSGSTLVQDWDFGTSGTIKNSDDLDASFVYHDHWGTIGNGMKYGALIAASSTHTKIDDPNYGEQPVDASIRSFTSSSLKTYLKPRDGASELHPELHNVLCGSFMAAWQLPAGGSRLEQDVIWETRVRMVTPPYFWFSIWAAGDDWDEGAEMDVVESFGFDNDGFTNFQGAYWHANSVGGVDGDAYDNWPASMSAHGITSYDASQYHVWTWWYRKDNTYSAYVDGIEVNRGTIEWTRSGDSDAAATNIHFLFDGGWGHTKVESVNHELAASELVGTYYEWDYSRVYLKR